MGAGSGFGAELRCRLPPERDQSAGFFVQSINGSSSNSIGLAPAIEYNFTSRVGTYRRTGILGWWPQHFFLHRTAGGPEHGILTPGEVRIFQCEKRKRFPLDEFVVGDGLGHRRDGLAPGIFALLGVVALSAGDETYISFLLGGGVAVLSGYSYAKLATRYPDAGGIATFFDKAFGAGRLSGTLSLIFLLTIAATIGMVAKAFGAYAATLALGHSDELWVNALRFGRHYHARLAERRRLETRRQSRAGPGWRQVDNPDRLISAGTYGMIYQAPTKHVAPHVLSVIGSVGLALFAYAGYAVMPNTAGSVAYPQTNDTARDLSRDWHRHVALCVARNCRGGKRARRRSFA